MRWNDHYRGCPVAVFVGGHPRTGFTAAYTTQRVDLESVVVPELSCFLPELYSTEADALGAAYQAACSEIDRLADS